MGLCHWPQGVLALCLGCSRHVFGPILAPKKLFWAILRIEAAMDQHLLGVWGSNGVGMAVLRTGVYHSPFRVWGRPTNVLKTLNLGLPAACCVLPATDASPSGDPNQWVWAVLLTQLRDPPDAPVRITAAAPFGHPQGHAVQRSTMLNNFGCLEQKRGRFPVAYRYMREAIGLGTTHPQSYPYQDPGPAGW